MSKPFNLGISFFNLCCCGSRLQEEIKFQDPMIVELRMKNKTDKIDLSDFNNSFSSSDESPQKKSRRTCVIRNRSNWLIDHIDEASLAIIRKKKQKLGQLRSSIQYLNSRELYESQLDRKEIHDEIEYLQKKLEKVTAVV